MYRQKLRGHSNESVKFEIKISTKLNDNKYNTEVQNVCGNQIVFQNCSMRFVSSGLLFL